MASGLRSTWARKSAGKGEVRPEIGPGVVPRAEERLPLGFEEQGQLGEGQISIRGDPGEERGEVGGHPLDGRAVEEVGRVLEGADETIRPLPHPQRKIQLGAVALGRGSAEHQPRQAHGLARGVLDGEEHLEDGRAAEIADRLLELLHQALKGSSWWA